MDRETAAEENSTAYFPLIDRIAEGRFLDCNTDQDLYETFLQVIQDDGHITDSEVLSSFQFALSIHSAAPRIEAHYQYYDTSVEPNLMVAQDAACPVWVHFNGKQYCSPALDRAQQDANGLKYVMLLCKEKWKADKRQGLRRFYHLIASLAKTQTGQGCNRFFMLISPRRCLLIFMRSSVQLLGAGRHHIESATGHPLPLLQSH